MYLYLFISWSGWILVVTFLVYAVELLGENEWGFSRSVNVKSRCITCTTPRKTSRMCVCCVNMEGRRPWERKTTCNITWYVNSPQRRTIERIISFSCIREKLPGFISGKNPSNPLWKVLAPYIMHGISRLPNSWWSWWLEDNAASPSSFSLSWLCLSFASSEWLMKVRDREQESDMRPRADQVEGE